MELIFDILPETGPVAFDIPELNEKDKKQLESELNQLSKEVDIKSENIGTSADWIVIVVYLTSLLFLGDKINKNLKAWLDMSKKFVSFIKRSKPTFIDLNGARLIAVEKILMNEENVDSIEEISFKEIVLDDLSKSFTDGRKANELRSKPYCYFNLIYKVNDYSYYIFGIKSTGEIKSVEKINESYLEFFSNHELN